MSAPSPHPTDHFGIGIVVVRRKLNSQWADHAWLPVAALSPAPAASPWTRLAGQEGEELFFAGPFEVTLHQSETSHYRDNLASGRPSLWVALRVVGGEDHEIATVTADPYEGEALAEGIGEIVEAVPMPSDVQGIISAFIDVFHVERAFLKRKRDRADREALARGPRNVEGGDKE